MSSRKEIFTEMLFETIRRKEAEVYLFGISKILNLRGVCMLSSS